MPHVNPQNLRWARETAALSVEEAAQRIGFRGDSAVEKLRQIESGVLVPTRGHLDKMAKAYNRPLLALFMPAPPREGRGAHDLRMLPALNSSSEALLKAIVRDAHVRQAVLRNALEDDEAAAVPWVGSVQSRIGADRLAEAMQEATEFDLREFRAQRSIAGAFSVARSAVERLGIFVLLIGDLGHHSRKVGPDVFRGIALPDPIAPFIIINDNDSKSAWTFTLFHELAHIFIGESAISGYAADSDQERLCDDAASRILLRREDLGSVSTAGSLEQQIANISAVAHAWKVSRKMVAYNLLRANRIQAGIYRSLARRFDEDRLEYEPRREGSRSDYYVVRTHRLGRTLIRTVDRMVASGALTPQKAALVLGVRPTAVSQLTEAVR
jgi:Zn-dependent peptidase ImmA (M78 family)/transcriptional regulator with XRE-family HTH domain